MGATTLRQRGGGEGKRVVDEHVLFSDSEEVVVETVRKSGKDGDVAGEKRKTYGKVPSGEVFVVPPTTDMIATLLSPSEPKNLSDMVVLAIIASHFLLFAFLPHSIRSPVLLALFIFWRASYNAGIGYLLHVQSNYARLVNWAKKYRIFDPEGNAAVYKFMKNETMKKMSGEDYDFDKAPIEFNTWLLFRRLVDLILMCDFVSYSLFAISCYSVPEGERFIVTLSRWAGGILLIAFNLWVKMDAHRVVKDYAWYWGDFFFLVEQTLTFDGVFEMAPHPMYSVGYAGYYGLSLIVASYTVLFASLAAHAAQFAFLTIVENPHIDKTYNPPPPVRRKSQPKEAPEGIKGHRRLSSLSNPVSESNVKEEPQFQHKPTLGAPDLHHVTHTVTFLLGLYMAALTLLTPNTGTIKTFFVLHALVWRLWNSFGIGYILTAQSNRKAWTRHFLKIGDSRDSAWEQWKGIYHLSMFMSAVSFLAAGYKLYTLPTNWFTGAVLLKHTLGALLIALHAWTSTSIYESLGEFGWFYGDFFFDEIAPKLTYSGIYRYLNNPERLIGTAGIWGVVLITSSPSLLILAIISHLSLLFFLQAVERPHMEKLYGTQLRKEAGIVKNIKRVLPGKVRRVQDGMDKAISEAQEFVGDFLESTLPKFKSGLDGLVQDTKVLIGSYPAKLTITQLADDLADYDPALYSLSIENAQEQPTDDPKSSFRALTVPYGQPVRVRWTAPKNHSKKDWIGLYRVADNTSRLVTRIASQGRWAGVCHDEYDGPYNASILKSDVPSPDGTCVSGIVEFSGDQLFWKLGVYEFRYHHAGKHNVMSLSQPFELSLPRYSDPTTDFDEGHYVSDSTPAIEDLLLPLVQACFDFSPKLSPEGPEDEFSGLGERKFARRIVYAVKEVFGVDFAEEVVRADGNVRRLAWRVGNARRVLAPFRLGEGEGK